MSKQNLVWSLAISLVFSIWVTAEVSAQTIVQVDCTKNNPKSINDAIDKNKSSLDQQLIVEISGMCNETVIINRRDNILLRGSDPLVDGIDGVSNSALRVHFSNRISVENLTITGSTGAGVFIGDSGLLNDIGFGLKNVRLEGNGQVGLQAFRSLVFAESVVVTGNGVGGIRMGGSTPSRLVCFNCTIEANPAAGVGVALRVVRTSNAVLVGSVLEGGIGLQTLTGGQVDLFNTTVTGSDLSIDANFHARVRAIGGSLTGAFSIATKSSLELRGVTQTSADPNVVRHDSYMSTVFQGIRTGLVTTALEDFSNASFRNSDLQDVTCSQGSNAYCEDVTKTSSSCGECPL